MMQQQAASSRDGIYLGSPLTPPTDSSVALREPLSRVAGLGLALPRQAIIGLILVVALLSFEIFNFDTTQFALASLLGEASFLTLRWATILAVAFCAIDFAGLAHLFTPEEGRQEAKEIWYLMGAWLLGATMNALMTWWAVSLTLLSHDFGNEVLGREELLQIVPVFVAVLVWLTRILFIGAFSVAGDHLFRPAYDQLGNKNSQTTTVPVVMRRKERNLPSITDEVPGFLSRDPDPGEKRQRPRTRSNPAPRNQQRVEQRPPAGYGRRPNGVPIAARPRLRT